MQNHFIVAMDVEHRTMVMEHPILVTVTEQREDLFISDRINIPRHRLVPKWLVVDMEVEGEAEEEEEDTTRRFVDSS